MIESVCPVCGRPDGAGHELRCQAVPPPSHRPRVVVVLNVFEWGLWAGPGPKASHPLFWFVRLGPVEVRLMRRRS